jgi:uncharacterized protein YceH (UPF0502 family)
MDVPELSFEETRVLGALVEKSQATPEYYPMSLHALTAACNQKSSREPVTAFDDSLVERTLLALKDKTLVAFATGTGRVTKYLHRVGQNGLGFSPAQACVVSLLMLRGAQTPGEIRSRAGRQFTFPSTELVQEVLASLMTPERPFVEEAARRPGQKEKRYRHRLMRHTESADDIPAPGEIGSSPGEAASWAARIEALERERDRLDERLSALENEFRTIRDALA